MTNKLLAFLWINIFLVACNNRSDKTGETKAVTDTTQSVANDPAGIKTVDAKLVCKELKEDADGNPQFDVLLSLDGKETKIKTIYNCGDISRSQYAIYEIPDNAIAASGGWWAGEGEYFYIVWRDGKCVVFEGWRAEKQEDEGYHWKEIAVK